MVATAARRIVVRKRPRTALVLGAGGVLGAGRLVGAGRADLDAPALSSPTPRRAATVTMWPRLHGAAAHSVLRPDDLPRLAPWGELWHRWVTKTFLQAYLQRAGDASFVPRSRGELSLLLRLLVLEKAIYELGYELNNRPEWVGIPLQGIEGILAAARGA